MKISVKVSCNGYVSSGVVNTRDLGIVRARQNNPSHTYVNRKKQIPRKAKYKAF